VTAVRNPQRRVKRSTYEKPKPGEPFVVGTHEKWVCCDCGLVHKFEFSIVGGKIRARAWRDNRSTAARRREHGITVKK
jgi:hypothetical protein